MKKSCKRKTFTVWLRLLLFSIVALESAVVLWLSWKGLIPSPKQKEKPMNSLLSISFQEIHPMINPSKSSIAPNVTTSSLNSTSAVENVVVISRPALQVVWASSKKSTICARSASIKPSTRSFNTWNWSIAHCAMQRSSFKKMAACRRAVSTRKAKLESDLSILNWYSKHYINQMIYFLLLLYLFHNKNFI